MRVSLCEKTVAEKILKNFKDNRIAPHLAQNSFARSNRGLLLELFSSRVDHVKGHFGFSIMIASALIIILTVTLGACSSDHPSDTVLIDNFQSHRSDFDHLLQMILFDKELNRVDYDWTDPENPHSVGITQERLTEYRKLFRKLNLAKGTACRDGKQTVLFIASTRGLSVTGSGKGYAYLQKQPELIVDNLDDYRQNDRKPFTAYRHVEGNWYLFLDVTP